MTCLLYINFQRQLFEKEAVAADREITGCEKNESVWLNNLFLQLQQKTAFNIQVRNLSLIPDQLRKTCLGCIVLGDNKQA